MKSCISLGTRIHLDLLNNKRGKELSLVTRFIMSLRKDSEDNNNPGFFSFYKLCVYPPLSPMAGTQLGLLPSPNSCAALVLPSSNPVHI